MNRYTTTTVLVAAAAASVVMLDFWSIYATALTDTGPGQVDMKGVQPYGIPPGSDALLDRPMASPAEPKSDSSGHSSMCYNGWVQGNDGPLYQCEVRNLPSRI